jgi:DNA-nicking Smr family endonuclease
MGVKKFDSDIFSFRPFKGLKKSIESEGVRLSGRSSRQEGEKPVTDEEIFKNAMKHVREIREFRNISVNRKKNSPKYQKRCSDKEALKALDDIVKGLLSINLADTQEYVKWINPDYSFNITKNLHEGRYSVQDCLDLHGLVVEEAEEATGLFIKRSVRNGLRCIKIIHGRGLRSPNGPVLKDAVIRLLSGKFRRRIIAFVTARQCDGGLGALYVLLK